MLGVPVKSSALNGIDSLLSIVQMPKGIPVGTLAIGDAGAVNAGLLAAAILALDRSRARASASSAYRDRQTQPRARAMHCREAAAVTPLLPGATIGVLGGGQLGRMIALAARRMWAITDRRRSIERDVPDRAGRRRCGGRCAR